MITFVLVISFIVHCVTLLAIIILYSRQNQYKEAERHIEEMKRELEEVLGAFSLELEESNREMSFALEKAKEEGDRPVHFQTGKKAKAIPKTSPSKTDEGPAHHIERLVEEVADKIDLASAGHQKKEHIPPGNQLFKEELNRQLQDHSQMALIEQALLLHAQGSTSEEIARTLGKGKNEIDLLLKFHT
ncbi:hypothetical protein [Bacillus testis]|uniref:hypothetical protein n=1 Tax=Bacillus testis TaxID=1622072 RepID=UPI00067F58DE|nr:hypothetical protein [Bacillus testis]